MALRDIIGQDRAIRILLKTIERDRIPSSYLFAGESGIGKKLTAINLAKVLNCLTSQAHDSRLTTYDCCDACSSCKKIDSNIHPDFTFIAPENGQIRIEEIRAINDILSFKAFEGRYKIVIVDDADTLNQFSANAFLKTLEEPPAHSLIVLISSNPDRLPDTIRSRCSRINFMPLPQNACEEVIRRGFSQVSRGKGHKSGEASRLAVRDLHLSTMVQLSMGQPGKALSEDLIEQRARFLALLKDMLHMEKDSWASREDMEKWFDHVLILLRDMAVMKITRNETQLINSDLKEYIDTVSNAMDIKGIIEQFQRLNALKRHLHFNLNKSLTWNYTGSLLRKDMDRPYA
jgi:DNA polymerase III subunit delta'